jgi:hypothetical protein
VRLLHGDRDRRSIVDRMDLPDCIAGKNRHRLSVSTRARLRSGFTCRLSQLDLGVPARSCVGPTSAGPLRRGSSAPAPRASSGSRCGATWGCRVQVRLSFNNGLKQDIATLTSDLACQLPLGLGSVRGHPLILQVHRRVTRRALRRPCQRREPRRS